MTPITKASPRRSPRWRRRRLCRTRPNSPALRSLPTAPWSCAILATKSAVAFRAARRFGHRQAFATQSFWWTIGGEGFSPTALVVTGLPAPTRFADMLTGAFESPEVDRD